MQLEEQNTVLNNEFSNQTTQNNTEKIQSNMPFIITFFVLKENSCLTKKIAQLFLEV